MNKQILYTAASFASSWTNARHNHRISFLNLTNAVVLLILRVARVKVYYS